MKWFRFYIEVLDDPKVQRLSPHLFKFWINCLCLAGSVPHRGIVPSVGTVAFRLRISEERAAIGLDELAARGFLDRDEDGSFRIHNWHNRQFKSDDVSARSRESMKRSRNSDVNVHMNVTDTEADTETETEEIQRTEAEADASAAAFQAYENCVGSLSAYIARKVEEDVTEFGSTCVVHCLEEASNNNARNLKYAESIMKRHQSEGCYDNGREADDYPTEEEVRQRVTWLAETRRQVVSAIPRGSLGDR